MPPSGPGSTKSVGRRRSSRFRTRRNRVGPLLDGERRRRGDQRHRGCEGPLYATSSPGRCPGSAPSRARRSPNRHHVAAHGRNSTDGYLRDRLGGLPAVRVDRRGSRRPKMGLDLHSRSVRRLSACDHRRRRRVFPASRLQRARGNRDCAERPRNAQPACSMTIALVVVVTVALAALELWAFWALGERDDRRRQPPRPAPEARPHRRSDPRTRMTTRTEPAVGADPCPQADRKVRLVADD